MMSKGYEFIFRAIEYFKIGVRIAQQTILEATYCTF